MGFAASLCIPQCERRRPRTEKRPAAHRAKSPPDGEAPGREPRDRGMRRPDARGRRASTLRGAARHHRSQTPRETHHHRSQTPRAAGRQTTETPPLDRPIAAACPRPPGTHPQTADTPPGTHPASSCSPRAPAVPDSDSDDAVAPLPRPCSSATCEEAR